MDDRNIHILLVEDNPGDARLIREMLTEAGTTRFDLTHAQRLDEALKCVAEASFDVLLLDLGLPDSQGLDTFNTVYDAAPAMPVLVFTGLADEELGTKAVRAGAQDYLMKGQLDSHLLARSVRYAIQRKRTEEELRQARDELERRVEERTAKLTEAVEQLEREIAQRKHAERAVRESEERYRALFEQAPDSILLIDLQTAAIVGFNDRAHESLGYTREEFTNLTITDLEAVESRDEVARHIQRVISEGSDVFETKHRTRDGHLRNVLVSAKVIRLDQRDILQSICSDITERKQADEARRKQHALLQAIIEGTADAISVKDGSGRYLMVNSAAARAFGGPKEDVIGKRDAELLSAESAKSVRDVDRGVMVTGEVHASEEPITIGNVKRMYASTRMPYRDGEGNIIGVIGIARDITEQRHLEEEILSISRREQQRIGQDLHDAMGQHLTGTAFLAKVLEKKLNESGAPSAAQATQIAKMINEAITLARGLAQGLCPVAVTAEGLMSALEEYRAHVESLFGVVCSFRCDEPMLVRDEAAATHLYRIVQEAVNNALKHGKAHQIEITMAGSDGSLTLAVTDDGNGLPEHFDNSKGMGLRIMAYRARMIGATLDIHKAPGGGAVVVCSFQSPTVARGDDRS